MRYLSGGLGTKGKAATEVDQTPSGECQVQYKRGKAQAAKEVDHAPDTGCQVFYRREKWKSTGTRGGIGGTKQKGKRKGGY